MVEYRRGVSSKRKNDLWHFHPECESFPSKTFAVRQDKPWEGNMCSECVALSRDSKSRFAA
jgi:hypothetical protein